MISSGMKRGLAASAVSALAVAGLPFLASSASATSGDTMSVASQGPIRNGNTAGGSVILKSSSATIDPAKVKVTGADYSNPVAISSTATEISSTAFDVDVKSFTLLDGDLTNNTPSQTFDKFKDGFYHYEAITAVTLGTASKATFGLAEDADSNNSIGAAEAKTLVEVTPTGAPASISVTPASQTTATNVDSQDYTVTVLDAAHNTTQLVGTEGFTASATGVTITGPLDASTMGDGVATFVAKSATGGTKAISIVGNDAGATKATITGSASLKVLEQADIATDEFDLATGADNWSSTSTFGSTSTEVRVDQDSVTFNFASKDGNDLDTVADDANKVILLTLGSSTLKVDGKTAPQQYSVVLDGDGKGSLTVKLSDVVDGSQFTFGAPTSNIATTTVTFKRARASAVSADSSVYVTKVGSPTAVTVTVKDQYGNPIGAPAQVAIVRGTRNGGTTTARTAVNTSGQATFSLPDAGTTAGTEDFTINLYKDQFDGAPVNSAGGKINYTVDGLGANYTVTGATSDPTATTITPLYDATAGAGDSDAISISGATADTPAKVSVDGGALLLSGGDTTLDKGAASKTLTLTGGNGSFTVVGTKTGVVTVTIENAGRTKTVKLTVKQPTDAVPTARNVAISAPEKAKAGQVATYTATVTDAFGNPVAGFSANDTQLTVNGPANFQSSDSVTDANGKLVYTVILTDNANSPVTARVNAYGSQFGSKANEIPGTPTPTSAPGLTASNAVASATIANVVNIAALQAAVDAAQDKLDAVQDKLTADQGTLAVARAQRAAAVKAVKRAKLAVEQAETRRELRAAKARLAEAKDNLAVAQAAVDAAKAVVAIDMTRLAHAQEVLAAAQQALADAQA